MANKCTPMGVRWGTGKEEGAMAAKKGTGTGKSRSAITGRYVKPSTAKRHPKTTITEGGKTKKGK